MKSDDIRAALALLTDPEISVRAAAAKLGLTIRRFTATRRAASIRFRRAKSRCEACGRPHGRLVLHLGDGPWWDEDLQRWRDGAGRTVRRLPPHSSILPTIRAARLVRALKAAVVPGEAERATLPDHPPKG